MIQHRWWHRWLQETACSGLLSWYLHLSKGIMEKLIRSSKPRGKSDRHTSLPYKNAQSMERFWRLMWETTKTHTEKCGKVHSCALLPKCAKRWARELRQFCSFTKATGCSPGLFFQLRDKGLNLRHRTVFCRRLWDKNAEMPDLAMMFWFSLQSWLESYTSKWKILCFNPKHLWKDFLELNKCPFYLLDILNDYEKAVQETSTSCICSSELIGHRQRVWGRMKCLFPISYRGQGQISEENHSLASHEVSREQFCVGISRRAEGKATLISLSHPQLSECSKRQKEMRL